MNRSSLDAVRSLRRMMEKIDSKTVSWARDPKAGGVRNAYFSAPELSTALSFTDKGSDKFIVLTRPIQGGGSFMPHELLYEIANDVLLANGLAAAAAKKNSPDWTPSIVKHYVLRIGLRAAYLSGFLAATEKTICRKVAERGGDSQATKDARQIDRKFVPIIQKKLNRIFPLIEDRAVRAEFVRRVDVPVQPIVVGVIKTPSCVEANGVWMDEHMAKQRQDWLQEQAVAMTQRPTPGEA